MRLKTLIASAVLLLSFVFSNAQNDADQSVRNIDVKLEAALSSSDVAGLEQILAAGYIEIDAQGGMKDRAVLLAWARARKATPVGQSVGPEKTVNEQTIRLHGNTAILVTLISTKYQFMDYQTPGPAPAQGPEVVDQERRLRVYFKTGERWQLVVQQTTAIPKR